MLSRFFLKISISIEPNDLLSGDARIESRSGGKQALSHPWLGTPRHPVPANQTQAAIRAPLSRPLQTTGDQMAGLSLGRIFCTFLRTLCNLTHFYNLPKIYLYIFQVHVNQPCFENSFICFPYINLFLFCVSCFNIFSPFPRINDEGTSWLSLASLTFQQNDFFELKKSVIWLFSFLYLDTL